MPSIHYEPEAFGLEEVGEIDVGGGYQYDMFTVWRRKADGVLLWGTDSGCSCDSPFETDGIDDLEAGTPAQAHEALTSWYAEHGMHFDDGAVAELHAKLAGLRDAVPQDI